MKGWFFPDGFGTKALLVTMIVVGFLTVTIISVLRGLEWAEVLVAALIELTKLGFAFYVGHRTAQKMNGGDNGTV